jgi:hypothetical protein
MVDKLREQSSHIVAAVDELASNGIKAPAKKFCGLYFEEKLLKDLFGEVEKNWPKLRSEIQQSSEAVLVEQKAIETAYEEDLERLKVEVYPTLQTLLNDKFEACFANIKIRSQESKKFAETRLTAPLKLLLDNSSSSHMTRQAQEENLWAAIIEGDAKYSALSRFSFQSDAQSEAKEFLAWDGISEAVYRTLDRKLPRMAP